MLTKKQYILETYLKHPYFKVFFKKTTNKHLVGRLLKIYFTKEKGSFHCITMVKANYHRLGKFIHKLATNEFLCVGLERRGLSSAIRTRFVDDGVLVERKFLLFSPKLFAIKAIPTSGVNKLVFSKAKLYYFTQNIIRKHLNIYYYS